MNWTKTSYLVLFVVFITGGVSSAYAITITLGGDPVRVLGDLIVDGSIDVSGNSDSDNDWIAFDDGGSELQWTESNQRFEFSDDLDVNGVLGSDGANINGELAVVEGNILLQSHTIQFTQTGGNIIEGTISIHSGLNSISAQTGFSDTLDTINGGTDGELLIIKPASGHTITVVTGGNIRTNFGGDLVLDGNDHAGFLYDGTHWNFLFRSNPVG